LRASRYPPKTGGMLACGSLLPPTSCTWRRSNCHILPSPPPGLRASLKVGIPPSMLAWGKLAIYATGRQECTAHCQRRLPCRRGSTGPGREGGGRGPGRRSR